MIMSIDIKIIMSIDTINVVYIDMKKRNLHEGYCVYTHDNGQPERNTACSVGRRRGVGTTQTKACVGGEGQAARYASASSAS